MNLYEELRYGPKLKRAPDSTSAEKARVLYRKGATRKELCAKFGIGHKRMFDWLCGCDRPE